MTNMEIAQTILAQLGGRQFTTMTGAKNLLAIERGLQLHLPGSLCRDHINCMRVVLDADDTYTVEFGRIRKVNRMPAYEVLHSYPTTYCDQLRGLFEDVTGLVTSLTHRYGVLA